MLQIWFFDYLVLSISSASELDWSLMSFATPDCTSRSFHLIGRGFKKEKMARRVVVGDYFKYFCLKGRLLEVGDLLRNGYYSRKYGMRCLLFFRLRLGQMFLHIYNNFAFTFNRMGLGYWSCTGGYEMLAIYPF